jgi:hypothetical protein
MLDTVAKYFPEADVCVDSCDGVHSVSFSTTFGPTTGATVDIALKDFKDTKVVLTSSICFSTSSISDAPSIYTSKNNEEIIDTFFIHYEVTKALVKLGVVETDAYKSLMGDIKNNG